MNQHIKDLSDDDFESFRTSRIRLLIAIAITCLVATLSTAAYFGFVLVGGDDAMIAFIAASAFTAGPGVLMMIFAYLALYRAPMKQRFGTDKEEDSGTPD